MKHSDLKTVSNSSNSQKQSQEEHFPKMLNSSFHFTYLDDYKKSNNTKKLYCIKTDTSDMKKCWGLVGMNRLAEDSLTKVEQKNRNKNNKRGEWRS